MEDDGFLVFFENKKTIYRNKILVLVRLNARLSVEISWSSLCKRVGVIIPTTNSINTYY